MRISQYKRQITITTPGGEVLDMNDTHMLLCNADNLVSEWGPEYIDSGGGYLKIKKDKYKPSTWTFNVVSDLEISDLFTKYGEYILSISDRGIPAFYRKFTVTRVSRPERSGDGRFWEISVLFVTPFYNELSIQSSKTIVQTGLYQTGLNTPFDAPEFDIIKSVGKNKIFLMGTAWGAYNGEMYTYNIYPDRTRVTSSYVRQAPISKMYPVWYFVYENEMYMIKATLSTSAPYATFDLYQLSVSTTTPIEAGWVTSLNNSDSLKELTTNIVHATGPCSVQGFLTGTCTIRIPTNYSPTANTSAYITIRKVGKVATVNPVFWGFTGVSVAEISGPYVVVDKLLLRTAADAKKPRAPSGPSSGDDRAYRMITLSGSVIEKTGACRDIISSGDKMVLMGDSANVGDSIKGVGIIYTPDADVKRINVNSQPGEWVRYVSSIDQGFLFTNTDGRELLISSPYSSYTETNDGDGTRYALDINGDYITYATTNNGTGILEIRLYRSVAGQGSNIINIPATAPDIIPVTYTINPLTSSSASTISIANGSNKLELKGLFNTAMEVTIDISPNGLNITYAGEDISGWLTSGTTGVPYLERGRNEIIVSSGSQLITATYRITKEMI